MITRDNIPEHSILGTTVAVATTKNPFIFMGWVLSMETVYERCPWKKARPIVSIIMG